MGWYKELGIIKIQHAWNYNLENFLTRKFSATSTTTQCIHVRQEWMPCIYVRSIEGEISLKRKRKRKKLKTKCISSLKLHERFTLKIFYTIQEYHQMPQKSQILSEIGFKAWMWMLWLIDLSAVWKKASYQNYSNWWIILNLTSFCATNWC